MESEKDGAFAGGLCAIGIPIIVEIEQLFGPCSRLLIGFGSLSSAQFAGEVEPILFVWRGGSYIGDIMNRLAFAVARVARDKRSFPSQLGIYLLELPLSDLEGKCPGGRLDFEAQIALVDFNDLADNLDGLIGGKRFRDL